ncbi:MAG TPA: FAD-dependent monooxygenase, partial [Burkholderiaceae bacterium]
MSSPTAGSSANCAVILGGGPVGLACALLLSSRGIASQVLDARAVDQARQDRRLLALSRGTLQLMTGLLGANFAPMARIVEVHVSSSGQWGATRLTSRDFGGVALGATIRYGDLVAALASAADADP